MSYHIRAVLLFCALLIGYSQLSFIQHTKAQQPDQAAPLSPELFGMVVRDPWYDFGTYPGLPSEPNRVAQERMGQILAETGVRWVRLEFFIEGSDDAAFDRHISRYDYFIREVAPRHKLKVLGLISYGLVRDIDPLDPNHGFPSPTIVTGHPYGGGVNQYMKTWLDRALAITNRYQGQVAAYEVLNEQNRLPPSGEAVAADLAARLHTKFYRLVKYPQPNDGAAWRNEVKLLIGGIHPKGTGDKGKPNYLSDVDYIRRLYGYVKVKETEADYEPNPLLPFQEFRATYGQYPLDGFAYHPYPEEIRLSLASDMDLISERLDTISATLTSLGDTGRLLWITEIGYNIGFTKQTEAGQAAFMQSIYTTLGARSDIATVFWFKYEDFPPASGVNSQQWGIVRIPFTENPSIPGGALYQADGEPAFRRASFFVYRELAGLPNYSTALPMISNAP